MPVKVNTHVSNTLNNIANSECFILTIFLFFSSRVLFGVQYPLNVAKCNISERTLYNLFSKLLLSLLSKESQL